MTLTETIEKKLQDAFKPETLEIENQSHLHAGHKGSPGTGESHFSIQITSEKFNGLSRVQAHQLVYQTLKEEIAGKVHALKISAKPITKESST